VGTMVESLTEIAREGLSKGTIHTYENMLELFNSVAEHCKESKPQVTQWLYNNLYIDDEAMPKKIWNEIANKDDLQEKFLQIPHKVLDDPRLDGLGTGEYLLYIVLYRYCWWKDRCNPSMELLARGTKASTKSVERWTHGHGKSKGLVGYRPDGETSKPLVTVRDRGLKQSNEYILNYKKITRPPKGKKAGQFV
jgi:hypothetical protein